MKTPSNAARQNSLLDLERRLAQPISKRLDALLRAAHPDLPAFASMRELVERLREPDADPFLKTLINAFRTETRDWDAFFVLLAALRGIVDEYYFARIRRGFDSGWGHVAHSISWDVVLDAFMDALYGFSGPEKNIAAQIRGRTLKALAKKNRPEKVLAKARQEFIHGALPLIEESDSKGLFDFFRDLRRVPDEPTPDEEDRRAAMRALDSFLEEGLIDEKDREVLVGYFVMNESPAEIGPRVGLRPSSVMTRVNRAKQRLLEDRKKKNATRTQKLPRPRK